MKEFKTRKALLNNADYIITDAEFLDGAWTVTTTNKTTGKTNTDSGLKVYNVGKSYGIYGMNAGLYELEDDQGHVTIAAVPDRSTLLFLLG
ncbi:hypothetical protein [Leuconostoc lactis]